jgi:hypothetical protein
MVKIHISSDWLRERLVVIKEHHDEVVASGIDPDHHGIVPDLVLEILRLRGEHVPELEYPHFPQFVVTEQ